MSVQINFYVLDDNANIYLNGTKMPNQTNVQHGHSIPYPINPVQGPNTVRIEAINDHSFAAILAILKNQGNDVHTWQYGFSGQASVVGTFLDETISFHYDDVKDKITNLKVDSSTRMSIPGQPAATVPARIKFSVVNDSAIVYLNGVEIPSQGLIHHGEDPVYLPLNLTGGTDEIRLTAENHVYNAALLAELYYKDKVVYMWRYGFGPAMHELGTYLDETIRVIYQSASDTVDADLNTVDFWVPADPDPNNPWGEPVMDLEKGMIVQIWASGDAMVIGGTELVHPKGDKAHRVGVPLSRSIPYGALMYKFDDGKPKKLGNHHKFHSLWRDAQLYLAINDEKKSFSQNSGGFQVKVHITG